MTNLIKVTTLLFITQLSFGQGFDMGGPAPEKKEKQRSEVSPNKQEFTAIQKKYQDQIVFSSTALPKIDKNNADPSTFTDIWDMKDPLVYRIYRTNTIAEGVYDYMKKTGGEFKEHSFEGFATLTVVYINGKEMSTSESPFASNRTMTDEWVTSSGTIKFADGNNQTAGTLGTPFKRAIHALGDDYKEGVFDFKIEIYAIPQAFDKHTSKNSSRKRPLSDRVSLLSTGNLKVKVTKEGMKNFAPVLCFQTLKQKDFMDDAELEKSIMAAYNRDYQEYGHKVTGANIFWEDWNIVKNAYGIPTKRKINAFVTYDKGDEHLISNYSVYQDYNGSGYQKTLNSFWSIDVRPYSPYCIVYKKDLIK